VDFLEGNDPANLADTQDSNNILHIPSHQLPKHLASLLHGRNPRSNLLNRVRIEHPKHTQMLQFRR
jgi:hypothetical protein